jgi:hypothetical protein
VHLVEVERKALLVELLGSDSNRHLPAMAVRLLGFAAIARERMFCLERRPRVDHPASHQTAASPEILEDS